MNLGSSLLSIAFGVLSSIVSEELNLSAIQMTLSCPDLKKTHRWAVEGGLVDTVLWFFYDLKNTSTPPETQPVIGQ